ncbi:MAG: Type 1 glutamine amidotransferase-like domain-containing protein [Candidatus Nanopelagicaceae bacterium]
MNGSIALVGSGEYLVEMIELERSLIDDGIANGRKKIYLQLPTAAGQESENRLQYWSDLGEKQAKRLGIQSVTLPIFDRESANNFEFAEMLEDAALIYLSGGNPHFLANTLRDTLAWRAIESNWRMGGSLAGCSAGAMALGSEVPHFRLSRTPSVTGFGLVPNVRVIPHFDKFFKWIPDSSAKLIVDVPEGRILMGIDEFTALVKQSSTNEWKVFGKSKVHILKGAKPQTLSHGESIIFDEGRISE